jgi:hypothetical protein
MPPMTPEQIIDAIRTLSPEDQAQVREALGMAPEPQEAFNPMAMMPQMMARMGGEGMQKMREQMASR